MWLLLYITLIVLPGYPDQLGTAYIMERFATEGQCRLARDRIGFDMAAAYPYERTFIITCHCPARQQT